MGPLWFADDVLYYGDVNGCGDASEPSGDCAC